MTGKLRRTHFFGDALPYLSEFEHTGALIVVEGPDGIGRTTQIFHLTQALEADGHSVIVTGLTRSELAGKGIQRAKQGNTLGPLTYELFYATDFADIFETQIIPSLRAGLIVLADRYIYTNIVRSVVRGQDPSYIRQVYSFALVPDLVIFQRLAPRLLIDRVMKGKGLNYWESGMDLRLGSNLYDSFLVYQERILAQFDKLAEDERFVTVDAARSIEDIQRDLRKILAERLELSLPAVEGLLPRVPLTVSSK